MTRRGDRGIKKGGLGDPVAQSIRAEQNRDAAPTPEEAQRMHDDFLSSEGCKVCGEDDPDKLNAVAPHMHSCSGHQAPPAPEPEVYCDDHKRGSREIWLQRQLEDLRKDDVVSVVIYECDIARTVTEPEPETIEVEKMVGRDDDGKGVYEMKEVPHGQPIAKTPVECRDGHGIEEVYYPDDIGPEEEN